MYRRLFLLRLVRSAALLVVIAASAIFISAHTVTQAADAACIRVGIAEPFTESGDLDPYKRVSSSGDVMYIVNNAYERLLDIGEDFKLIPRLAESWDHNADATEWTFHIRKGVKFQDGKELTAKDVVYSYQRMADPKNNYPAMNQLAGLKPENFSAKDANTLVVKLEQPIVELPLIMSFFEGVIIPDGADGAALKAKTNGTGPYMVDSYTPGKKVQTLKKNPNYWQQGLPKNDCVELQNIEDATARTAALRSGQIDLSTSIGGGIDLATVGAIKADPNIKVLVSKPVISLIIWMWVDTPPFDNVKVRQALKLVVDRDFMVNTVLLGYAIPGDDHPVLPTSAAAWRHEVPKQDIAKAKQLLAEAGYSDSKPLKVTLNAAEIQPGALNMAAAFKEMAAQAGVQVEIAQTPLDKYWDTIWLKQPMGLSSWGVRAPAQALTIAYGCDAKFQETKYCNKAYDALVKEAAKTIDDTKRIDLYKKAEQMLVEDGGLINVLFFSSLHGMSAKCSGFTAPAPFYQVDFLNMTCSK